MKILVTGGEGQVGSELSREATHFGVNVIALGKRELDVTSKDSILRALREHDPDILINAAAYTAVDQAEVEPERAKLLNTTAVLYLAEACRASSIPIIHISTDYVFDGCKPQPYLELDKVSPRSVYGKTKEAGEARLRGVLPHYIIVRTSWVFSSAGGNFLTNILKIAREQGELKIVSDQFGGPTSAKELSKLLIRISLKYFTEGSLAWGTYHFCQAPYVSWWQFASSIIHEATKLGLIGVEVPVMPIKTADLNLLAARPMNSRLDTKKLKLLIDFESDDWRYDVVKELKKVQNFD